MAGNRKRKNASPVKNAPLAKRQQDVVSSTANPSAAPPPTPKVLQIDVPAAPSEELEQWELVSREMGWTPTDCLSFRVSFPKRADAKTKVETLAAHLKHLRAVGWHLYDELAQSDLRGHQTEDALHQEKAARAVELKKHEEETQLLSVKAEGLAAQLDQSQAEASRRAAELLSVRTDLSETAAKLKETEAAQSRVSAELESQKAAASALQQRISAAETSASDAQKYNSQLQEFNVKMAGDLQTATEEKSRLQEEKAVLAEEAATLRGRVSALGDALSRSEAANLSIESVRQVAAEEIARLRADLAAAGAERSSFAADLSRLRTENEDQRRRLERFQAATGKDLAALEAERASSAVLANRTAAQTATVAALQDQLTLLKEQRAAAQAQSDSKTDLVRTLSARVAELESLLSAAEERVREGETVRRRLHNTILELKGNVRVFCRVRPPTDTQEESELALTAPDATEIRLTQPPGVGPAASKGPQCHVFQFDRVFGASATQAEVFEEVSMLVQSALDGYRVTIFAFGQTSAGKTHTMLGRPGEDTEGIIPRAVRQVFATAAASAAQGWRYTMRAAMLEIYNEELKDLLAVGAAKNNLPAGKKHVISHEEKTGGTSISFLEWVDVDNEGSVAALLKRAMTQRSVGATASNEQSSRSHMVFMLTLEGSNETTGQKMSGALNLVDLAGSERLAKSGAVGERLKETQAINKSLSALGDVIAALGARDTHVPYRNSKLTYLLQNSLSGAGKCLMLCNVNPSAESAAESLCTLRFAAKVNSTEIGVARRNVMNAGGR